MARTAQLVYDTSQFVPDLSVNADPVHRVQCSVGKFIGLCSCFGDSVVSRSFVHFFPWCFAMFNPWPPGQEQRIPGLAATG